MTIIHNWLVAIVKFNGGRGALLCNRCRKILATGFNHEDREHLCAPCTAVPVQPDLVSPQMAEAHAILEDA